MRIQSFLYVVVATTLLAIPSGCSEKNDAQSDGNATSTIKLTQNGQLVTEFTDMEVGGVSGDGYEIALSSADNKHNLTLDVKGSSPGTYPFIKPAEPLTAGKANFMYLSYDLPEASPGTAGILNPGDGQVVVTIATKTRLTGSFKSTTTNSKNGKTYTLEGTFDARAF